MAESKIRTAEIHKRYDYNSNTCALKVSKHRNCNPLSKCKVCRGGLNPTNVLSRINVAILGVFLDLVYQRMQKPTDHAIQNHMYWQGGIFASEALESLSALTGQQMKKRVQAASAPLGCLIGFCDAKFHKFDFF